MKRWLVKKDNLELKLYYKTKEDCEKANPNAEIEECFDYEYLDAINYIINKSEFYKVDYKGRDIYKIDIPLGYILYRPLMSEGLLLDCVEYQLWTRERFVNPITWTMSDVNEFNDKFFNNTKPIMFEVHTFRKYGEPKMKKPKELNKISSCFKVDFIPKKCSCQCFKKDDDLYIHHKDFFSEEMRYDDCDFGTPLEYRAKKYLNIVKANKFSYSDSWGSIVCRNEAWIVFKNIFSNSKIVANPSLLSRELLKVFSKYHKVSDTYFVGGDWEYFFERLAKEVINYEK